MTGIMEMWRGAVTSLEVRHIDPTCTPVFQIVGDARDPSLFVAVRQARDTRDQDKRFGQLNISTIRLTYWPGLFLAQAWMAAGWAGYLLHEALELATVHGIAVLDPHQAPFHFDKGLRCGFPVELTPSTLEKTLTVVMEPDVARTLIAKGGL